MPTSLGKWDVLLLLYACGWAAAELAELISNRRKYGAFGTRKYLHDPFNLLDLSMVAMMLVLLTTRSTIAVLGHPDDLGLTAASWMYLAHDSIVTAEVPCQALLTLVSWLRIMEVLFLFPQTGPLLLMAIRMLQDLAQFLTLFLFVVVSFGCSFYVLFSAAQATHDGSGHLQQGSLAAAEAEGGVAEGGVAEGSLPADLSVITVVRLLVQGTLNGESDYVLQIMHTHSPIAWALMFLFGVIVVLLLLNLLIARFAKVRLYSRGVEAVRACSMRACLQARQ